MVTVDDLVISLTIKETSKLGQLQKQLEAIVGKRGEKAPIISLDPTIKNNILSIKKQVEWLRPTQLPGRDDPRGMRRVSGSLLRDINEYQRNLVKKLTTTPSKGIKTLKEEFRVTTDEELETKMFSALDNLKEIVGDIFDDVSLLSSVKKEEVVAVVSRLISESKHMREIGLELWRALNKLMPEDIWQSKILDLFRAMGAKTEPKKSLYMVKPEALILPEIQKKLGLGVYKEEISNLLEEIKQRSTDVDYEVREIQNFFSMQKFQAMFGLQEPDQNELATYIADIIKSKDEKRIEEMYEKIKSGFFTKLTEKDVRDIGLKLVSKETKLELDEIVKDIYGWTKYATEGAKEIDIAVADIGVLKEELGIQISGIGEVGFELKRIFTKENIDQLLMYMKYYGEENVVVLAEQIAGDVLDRLKSLGLEKNLVLLSDLRAKQAKFGIKKTLTDPESEKFKETYEKLTKGLEGNIEDNIEEIKQRLEDLKAKGEITEETYHKIIELMKRLGVNPNWVDLPEFTQDMSEQIREIREQTEKIGTKESGELLENFLQLREKLDIPYKLDDLDSFITGLEVGISEMKTLIMPEEDRTEITNETLKAIENLKNTKLRVLEEEYTQFPQIIMDTLSDIRNKTLEFQEKGESQWKKSLLVKIDDLIKNVSEYRKELIDTIGSQYFNKPPETGTTPQKF